MIRSDISLFDYLFSFIIPIQKSKLTRRRAADSTHVRQGETTKLGYFFGLVSGRLKLFSDGLINNSRFAPVSR
jgi:hypothetical protein